MSYGALERNGEASHSTLNKLATRQASEERWLLARSSSKVVGGADMLNGGSSMTMTNEESVVATQRKRTEEARMEMERSYEAIRKRTTETRGEAWKPAAAAAASRPSSAATGGAAATAEANGGASRWGEATTRRSVSLRDLDAAAAGGEEEGEWVEPPPRRITQAALDELPLEDSFSFSRNRPVAVRSPSPLPHRALGYMPRRSLSREVVARVSPPPPPPPAAARKPEEARRPSPIVVQAESRRPSSARPSPARAESHSRRPTPAPAPDPAPALYAAMQQELRATRESMSTFTTQLKAMSTRIVELETSERRSTSQLSRSEARLAKLRERTAQLEAEVTALREASLTRFEETERNVDTLRTGAKAFREAVDRRFEAQLRGAAAASERRRPAPIQLPPPPPPHLPPPPPPPVEQDTSDQWAYGRSPPPVPEAHAEAAPAEEASSARLEEELRSRLLSLRRTRNSATASPLPEGEQLQQQQQQQQDGEADESLENLKGRVERSRARAKAFQESCAQRESDRQAAAEAEPLSAVESVQTLIMPPTSASAAAESRNEGDESAPPTAATEGVEDPLEALRRRVAASRRAKAAQEASSASPQPHASASQRASLVRSREESTLAEASEAKRARTESAASLSSLQPAFVAPLAEASGSSAAANVASPAASSSSRALDKSGAVGKVQWGTPVGLQETPLQGGEQFAPLVLAIRQLCGWPGFIARAALEPLKISRVQVVLQHIKPTILQGYNNDISFFIQKAQAYVAIELELSRAVPSNPRDTLRGASINLRDVHRPYYTQIVNGVPTLKMQIKLLCARAHINHEEYTSGQISWAAQAIPLRVAFSDEHFPFPFNLGPEWADTIGRPEFYFPFVDALRLHPNGALVSELQAQLRSWLGDEVMRGVAAGLGSFNHYIGAALLHISLEYCSDIHVNRVRLTQETFNAPFKTFEANQLYFANAAERMAAIEAARQRRETQLQALQPSPPPPAPTSSAEAAQSNVIVESLFDGATNTVEPQQAQPYAWTPDSTQLDPSAPRIPIPGFPGL